MRSHPQARAISLPPGAYGKAEIMRSTDRSRCRGARHRRRARTTYRDCRRRQRSRQRTPAPPHKHRRLSSQDRQPHRRAGSTQDRTRQSPISTCQRGHCRALPGISVANHLLKFGTTPHLMTTLWFSFDGSSPPGVRTTPTVPASWKGLPPCYNDSKYNPADPAMSRPPRGWVNDNSALALVRRRHPDA